jgi:hypothetical protein
MGISLTAEWAWRKDPQSTDHHPAASTLDLDPTPMAAVQRSRGEGITAWFYASNGEKI